MHERTLDRFHRIVVTAALVILPLAYLIKLVGELTDGDDRLFPRWYTWTPFIVLSLWQGLRRRPNALWIIVPAIAFVPLILILQWQFDAELGSVDSATALALLLLLGFVMTLVVEEWPTWASWAFSATVAVTAYVGGLVEGLDLDDTIVRTLTAASAVALASWLARSLRKSLIQSVREQEELVASRDRLVAAVSHELRTPLTAIAGLSEEIAANGDHLDREELIELSRVIAEQSVDMTDIVEDLITAAQARAGNLRMRPVRVDLAAEVARVATAPGLDRSLAERRFDVRACDVYAFADPQRLRQIVRNLLSNAVRYGGKAIEVAAASDGERVRLTVSDDGEGLDEALALRAFEPFFGSVDRGTQPGSVGLGLAISRQLASLMDGKLGYLRQAGRTVFEVELPAFVEELGLSEPTAPAST